ncbi:MAG: glutaminase A [Solirubrobacteraceae bacterium]|nr:glutaminase A [Solirubrobacteraceae bacterium]
MLSLVEELVTDVHAACVDDRSGDILHGIPALEGVDPELFGICVATADGFVYEVGDTRVPLCIQSISKAFTYGIALTDRGTDVVDAKIDVEPSGEAFNEISIHPVTHRPRNPMINAGAITASSLVAGDTVAEQVERVTRIYSKYAGREVGADEDIYASQLASGHRNRAIAHMLREFGILEGDPNDAIEVYLRQCSTMVDCRDLALMGATLANGGRNPQTGERACSADCTERVLSVMSTCGMYDAAGEWVASVGMAAKSGVGGGIVAVLPGQLSIAVFSPRLDERGNSVRGVKACRMLSARLELHALHVARGAHSAVRDAYDLVEAPSSLQRPASDRAVLDEHGPRVRIYELQGDLLFAGAESVVREISQAAAELEIVVLDVRRIRDVAEVSRGLLGGLRATLDGQGCAFALIDPDDILRVAEAQGERAAPVPAFPTIADATVWCEERLLERYGVPSPADETFDFADHPLLSSVPQEHVEGLRAAMTPRSYADGELIVPEGDDEAGVFLIMSGRVRSTLTTVTGATRHLASLTPGTCFGDAYVTTDSPHPLTMRAEGPVELLELTRAAYARIRQEEPGLHATILQVFMFAIRDDLERSLSALASGRVAPTSS